jgi:hypothetical protein
MEVQTPKARTMPASNIGLEKDIGFEKNIRLTDSPEIMN